MRDAVRRQQPSIELDESPGPLAGRRRALAQAGVALAGAWLAARPGDGCAQAWPSRPIRVIAPSAPGGITDQVARILAERMARSLGVPVVVENRTGGTGAIALDLIAHAPPDGYTIGVGFTGANIILPLLNSKLTFDAQKDFTPIAQFSLAGNLLVVNPSVPVRSLKEFIDYAKAQPQPVGYGSWGNGSGGHLAGEYLKILTGLSMNHVPYRSTTALMTDMVGGHMPIGFLDPTNVLQQVRAGKLRAIAQTGPTRLSSLADVPTMLESGVAFGVGSWLGMFGPANLPRPIVQRLNAEIVAVLRAPDLADRWVALVGGAPVTGSPEDFEKTIRADWEVWKGVIEKGKITLDQ